MHERDDMRPGTKEKFEQLLTKYLHSPNVGVYSSYTRMDGDRFGPGCRIETVWGFRDEDMAIMGSKIAGPTYEERETLQYWVNGSLL